MIKTGFVDILDGSSLPEDRCDGVNCKVPYLSTASNNVSTSIKCL